MPTMRTPFLLCITAALAAGCFGDTDDDEGRDADVVFDECRTECEDVHTACLVDCGDDSACTSECDQNLTLCVDECR